MNPLAWVRAVRSTDLLGPHPARSLGRLGRASAQYGLGLFAVVSWRAAEDPDRVAVREDEVEFTYRQVQRVAEAVAQWLADHLQQNTSTEIALWCQRPVNAVVALLAAQRLGIDLVLLNTQMSHAEASQAVGGRGCLVLSDDPRYGDLQLPALEPEVGLAVGHQPGEFSATSGDRLRGRRSSGGRWSGRDPQMVTHLPRTRRVARISILSSGTTGVPREVGPATSRAAVDTVAGFVTVIGVRRHDHARVLVPLFHGHGLGTVLLGLVLAGTLTLRAPAQQRTDGYASDWAALGSTDLIVGVPTVLRRMLAARPADQVRLTGSRIRAIITGSAPLDEGTLAGLTDAFGQVVHNVYGTSETGVITHAGPDQLAIDPATVGAVLPGLECEIRTPDGRSAAIDEVGEVWVRGSMVGPGWRATGDLGSQDSHGWLRLSGRADDALVIGGELVVPETLEARICAINGVVDCAVRGVPDAEYGTRVELAVQRAVEVSPEQLRAALDEALPRTLRPVSIIEVAELPRTATGKLQRRRLPSSPPRSGS